MAAANQPSCRLLQNGISGSSWSVVAPELLRRSAVCGCLWIKRIDSALFFATIIVWGSSEEPGRDLAKPPDLWGTSQGLVTHRVCLCSRLLCSSIVCGHADGRATTQLGLASWAPG